MPIRRVSLRVHGKWHLSLHSALTRAYGRLESTDINNFITKASLSQEPRRLAGAMGHSFSLIARDCETAMNVASKSLQLRCGAGLVLGPGLVWAWSRHSSFLLVHPGAPLCPRHGTAAPYGPLFIAQPYEPLFIAQTTGSSSRALTHSDTLRQDR